MDFLKKHKNIIFSAHSGNFDNLALELFHYQATKNQVYGQFLNYLGINPVSVNKVENIPFMPVRFFKKHRISTGSFQTKKIFYSSGTTSKEVSRHYIADPGLYDESILRGFGLFFGSLQKQPIMALLPSYREKPGSSLAYMAEKLIQNSSHPYSGFYLNDHETLYKKILEIKSQNEKLVLFGVSYALLDFANKYPVDLEDSVIIETGGMKGRRKEMIRDELHELLKKHFAKDQIQSEYGMTELLSQAYSLKNGIFMTPPWMKVMIRDQRDPFEILEQGETGGINVIDLANLHSCAFLAVDDIGRKWKDGSFEVLGRFDHSGIRGCNLMVR